MEPWELHINHLDDTDLNFHITNTSEYSIGYCNLCYKNGSLGSSCSTTKLWSRRVSIMALFSATTLDDMMKSFPTHNIVPIIGRPTYKVLKPLDIKGLHTCAKAISSQQVQGHLYLTTTEEETSKRTSTLRQVPKQPTNEPTLPDKATAFQVQQVNQTHDKLIKGNYSLITTHERYILEKTVKSPEYVSFQY